MRHFRFTTLIILILANFSTAETVKRGDFTLSFTERSPLSDFGEIRARLGERAVQTELRNREETAYDLSQERFEVYVPPNYQPGTPYGLLVWIHPQGSGQIREAYKPTLENHRLIWIAPNKSGNNKPLWHRIAPAIDAVHNMKKRYTIDPKRVYVGGYTDGARAASVLAVAYPEIFHGGFYMHGGHYIRRVEVPIEPGRFFYYFKPPPDDALALLKRRNRYVFLSGDHEMHRRTEVLVKTTYESYKADGFSHVVYIRVPGMRRKYPDSEWFRKGIAFMENPTAEINVAGTPIPSPTPRRALRQRRQNPVPAHSRFSDEASSESPPLSPGSEIRIEAAETKKTFLVYTPIDYTLDRRWPVIFCYHGYSGSATTWPFRQVTEGRGFIVVGMNYATTEYHKKLRYEKTGPEKVFFDEAYKFVSTNLNIDPELVFMGGYSQGGYSTTVLGEQMLDRLTGWLILGAGRTFVDQHPPPAKQIRGHPVFYGAGELDDPHYLRAKRAVEFYKTLGADVTFEGWPNETHGLSPNWQTKTKMHDWLIAHGPSKQVASMLDSARAAEASGRLGEAFTLFDQVAGILPEDKRCIEAAASAEKLFGNAQDQLARAENAMKTKPYPQAAKQLRQVAQTYVGSVFAVQAQTHLKDLLNTKADELETRAHAAEVAGNSAKALQLYELYLDYFPEADRYQTVKAHVKELRAKAGTKGR